MSVSLILASLERLSLSAVAVAGLLYIALQILVTRTTSRQLPLPPGPKPWPIVGNVSDFPVSHEGRFWAKHKELYGPISCVNAMGIPFIILNDVEVAFELLDKRSAFYSSRIQTTFGGKMIGLGRFTPLAPYDHELRRHRKLIHAYIGTVSSMRWIETVQRVESRRLLLRILNHPSNFSQHIRTYSGAVILKISHGYTIEPEGQDPLIDLAENVLDNITFPAMMSGIWAVDIFPFLRYLPSWLPGMGFKRTADTWRDTVADFCDIPYNFTMEQMAAGKDRSSFTSYNIEQGMATNRTDEDTLKNTATALFAAGSDTTVSILTTFFLAMILFPDVLRKAHDEVDRVVGGDRLPDFGDAGDLPYISALIKELLRWEEPVSTGIPHLCTRDDTYAGYRIPEGSVVIPNIWQMSRNPDIYKNPSSFMPERFLGESPEPDPYLLAFGFGRRVCPGKRMAESSLFISIAMLIATFDIRKAKDECGRDIDPECLYKPGLVAHPTPFKCSITPRPGKAVELIHSVLSEHPFEKGDGDVLKLL